MYVCIMLMGKQYLLNFTYLSPIVSVRHYKWICRIDNELLYLYSAFVPIQRNVSQIPPQTQVPKRYVLFYTDASNFHSNHYNVFYFKRTNKFLCYLFPEDWYYRLDAYKFCQTKKARPGACIFEFQNSNRTRKRC